MNSLEETLACFVFSDKTTSDKFHENWEVGSEPGSFFTKERGFSNAPWIHAAEGNSSQLVILGMKIVGRHHQAQLGIFVGLGTNETISISHGDRLFESSLESLEVVQICNGIDTATSDCIVIPCHRSDHDDPRVWRVDHALHELTDHQKVRQKVCLHGLFVTVQGPLGMVKRGLVDSCVANETIDGFGHAELVEVLAELPNALKGVEFTLHRCKVVHIESIDFSHRFHLVEIPNGSDHMVLSRSEQREGSFSAQSRRASGNHGEFLVTKLLFDSFLVWIIRWHLEFRHPLEALDTKLMVAAQQHRNVDKKNDRRRE
mmetsp:Transcript_14750/g.25557  ORF Transcript_14750/g.25557 Transcript_14750/m.25557 type:complete len:316 (-) Transcript_14750:183-1130(-)